MRHRLHPRAHGLRKGDEHPAYTPPYGTLYLLPLWLSLGPVGQMSGECPAFDRPTPGPRSESHSNHTHVVTQPRDITKFACVALWQHRRCTDHPVRNLACNNWSAIARQISPLSVMARSMGSEAVAYKFWECSVPGLWAYYASSIDVISLCRFCSTGIKSWLLKCIGVGAGYNQTLTLYYCKKNFKQLKTSCKDDCNHTTKTANIKKALLLSSTSPCSQCADK